MKRTLKTLLLGASLFCLQSAATAADATYGSTNQMQNMQRPDRSPAPAKDWHQVLMEKEGCCVEGGVELLIMTSTLTTTFSDESFIISQIPFPNTFTITDRSTKSISPDYNVGFALDVRYRTPQDQDIGLYYKYIRNNGDGSVKKDKTAPITTGTQRNRQDDQGSMHSHMHIIDLLYGRTLPLSPQSTLRLAGGLSYHNFDLSLFFDDDDRFTTTNNLGVITGDTQTIVNAHQRGSFWGLGPKFEADFQYYFLPTSWNHDFNLYFIAQFALLCTKEWSSGKLSTEFTNFLTPATSTSRVTWTNHPKFEFIPNINLDMGMKYDYHCSNGVAVELAAGYRVLAYWELDELSRFRTFAGGDDFFFFFFGSSQDDNFSYSGPYVRFAVFY